MTQLAAVGTSAYPIVGRGTVREGETWVLRARIEGDDESIIQPGATAGQCPELDILVQRRIGPLWQTVNQLDHTPSAGIVLSAYATDASWTEDGKGYNVRLNLTQPGTVGGELYAVDVVFYVEAGGATASATRLVRWELDVRAGGL
jgi:hypothetical protein